MIVRDQPCSDIPASSSYDEQIKNNQKPTKEPENPWRETVRDIYDACLLKNIGREEIMRMIEHRYAEYFCGGH